MCSSRKYGGEECGIPFHHQASPGVSHLFRATYRTPRTIFRRYLDTVELGSPLLSGVYHLFCGTGIEIPHWRSRQLSARTCPALFLPLEIEFLEGISHFQPFDKDVTQTVESVNSQSGQLSPDHLRLARIIKCGLMGVIILDSNCYN